MTRLQESLLRECGKQLCASLIPTYDIDFDRKQRAAAIALIQAHRNCLETGAETWDEFIAKIDAEIAEGATAKEVLG